MKKSLIPIAAFAILLVVMASVALVSAAPPAAPRAAQSPSDLEGVRWVLVSYRDQADQLTDALPDAQATAEFAAGNVAGSAGCNSYTASYEAAGESIKVGKVASTMKMCDPAIMDQETAFLANLQTAAELAIDGGQLTLFDDLGAPLLVFNAEQPGTLVGSWVMTSFNNGRGGFESALDAVTVTAVFDAEGKLTGNAGCNTYSASFEVDGDKIAIGPAITTRMSCAPDVMTQEAAYLKALEAATVFAIQGTELVLRDGEGAAQVGYNNMAVVQGPAQEPTAAPVATPGKVPGVYLTLRPGASGGVQTVVLGLVEGGKAEFTREFGKESPLVETGTWVENADGTVTVTLTDQGGKKLAKPDTLKFQRDGAFLTLVDFDKAQWGESGLKLNLAADIARKVRSALLTLDLANGLALDPTFVSVNGGGEVDASLLSPDCKGYINRQPVVTVRYPGGGEQVRTFFYSDGDPTLVIMTPDGKLLCNDNAGPQLLDPFVALDNPVAGDYRVWVGSAAKNQLIPGVLVFTANPGVDLGSFQLGSFIKRPSIPQAMVAPVEPAAAGAQLKTFKDQLVQSAPTLRPGFKPVTANVTAEGIIPLFRLPEAQNQGCGGLVTGAPSYAFKWTGDTENIHVSFTGDADSTLMVVGANNKTVLCNDDAKTGDPNPAVDIANPQDDIYLVYVGRLNPEKPVTGTLTVAEAAKEVTQ